MERAIGEIEEELEQRQLLNILREQGLVMNLRQDI